MPEQLVTAEHLLAIAHYMLLQNDMLDPANRHHKRRASFPVRLACVRVHSASIFTHGAPATLFTIADPRLKNHDS